VQRLRVLLDAGCLSDGRRAAGIGRYAQELIAALRSRDDVDIDVAQPERPPRSESRPGRFLHAQPAVLRAAARFRPHVVHALGGEPVLAVPSSRQVVTVHDVEMWREQPPTRLRGVALRAYGAALAGRYRACAAVVAVSRTTAEEATRTLGLDGSRVHVVPHGVSAVFTSEPQAADDAIRSALGLDDRYVVWSGSLRHHDPRKGLDSLLDAMSLLGPGITLALAGAPGAESDRVATRTALMGVRTILCGQLSDARLGAVLRGARALVISSRHEGFGLPALEAMACGAPVIATSVGNLPDLAGPAAILVPPRDSQALASSLRCLLADGGRAGDMRRAGLARAAQFSWQRAAERVCAVYREVARAA